MSFPIDPLLPELLDRLSTHPNVVLQAAPGAGKTTRIPIALLDAPWLAEKKMVMLEPRRITARAAARYMAASLGQQVGDTVGYRVRQDSKVGARTRIEVVTEGILTRMLQQDPALEQYGLVIFDEFHERNLNSDLGLALCLDAQQGLRDDLRLLVMSATLDGASVARLMQDAPVLNSTGRSFPVTVHHRPLKASLLQDKRAFLQGVAHTIADILRTEHGSVLVFLPGAGEITQIHALLRHLPLAADVILAPLYGQLSPQQQDQALLPAPAGMRKVVLASAIAETSLTIEGIGIVIDSGLMRQPRFDANTGLTRLVTLPVSQASAEQRCGRAGRLSAGTCYRLWPAQQYLLPYTAPEILAADLAPLVLELAQWGVPDYRQLRWLDAPPQAHVAQAQTLLQELGALDGNGRITRHGQAMAQWGAHPRLTHMMLRSTALHQETLACELAALLNERDPIRGGAGRSCDLRLRIELLRAPQPGADVDKGALTAIRDTARQWRRQLPSSDARPTGDLDDIGVMLAYAYPDRVARRRDSARPRYLLANGRGAWLPEDEPLAREEYIVAAHLDGEREARIFLAAAIDKKQLLEFHQDLIQEHHSVLWDDRNDCVQARKYTRIGQVVLSDEPWQQADPDAVHQALIQGIRQAGSSCLPWTDKARSLQARCNFLHEHMAAGWPDYSEQRLLATLESWLSPYLGTASRLSHLHKIDIYGALLAPLTWEQQQQLEQLAPTHLTVPSGSRIALDYTVFPPVLAVRMQEMFGLSDTPRIAGNRISVLLHLLSPARRPVQITQDLAGFWQTSYLEVKKELKGRYPKHYWPDDPLQAQPRTGIRKKP